MFFSVIYNHFPQKLQLLFYGIKAERTVEIFMVKLSAVFFTAGNIILPRKTRSGEVSFRSLVLNLNEKNVEGILLGNECLVKADACVYRSYSLFKLQCSLGLFGQVLDVFGDNKVNTTNYMKETELKKKNG
jgi:flagellar biosynthesis/type III secretory pathway ATPase